MTTSTATKVTATLRCAGCCPVGSRARLRAGEPNLPATVDTGDELSERPHVQRLLGYLHELLPVMRSPRAMT